MYEAIKKKHPKASAKGCAYLFTRAISQLSYNDKKVDVPLVGWQYETHAWLYGAGAVYGYSEEEAEQYFKDLAIKTEDYRYLRYMVRLQNQLCGNDEGVNLRNFDDTREWKKDDYKNWKKNMGIALGKKMSDKEFRKEYEQKCKDFSGKGDFAHMMYTLAANLNDDGYKVKNSWSVPGCPNMSWSNAEERKDIAGWLGDAVYLGGGLGGSVSFGQDDWIADLDSDNLAHRMQSNSQCDLVDVMNDYYSQVSKEKDSDEVRAQEFLRNNPYKEVENDVLDRLNWGSERYSQLRRLNLDDLHRGSAAYKDTVNFLDRLKRYDNAK